MQNYELLCAKVVSIAKLAGNFIRKESMAFDAKAIEIKGTNDLVSYVDKTAEKQIVRNLRKLIKGAGFITEEDTVNTVGEVYTWIVDPLDGTTNFMHGLPVYSVSIALYEHNYPVVGVVYEIGRGEMFYTYKGGAAYLNNREIRVSTRPTLGDSLLATGFPYTDFDHQPQYMELLAELMKGCHGLRRMGSAAVDLAYVACGRFDGYYEKPINAYDVAAGAYLVQQAGGHVYNFDVGSEYDVHTREIVAGNGLIDQALLDTIKKYYK